VKLPKRLNIAWDAERAHDVCRGRSPRDM